MTTKSTQNKLVFGDNLPHLHKLATGSVQLIYVDPPFNTGNTQVKSSIRTVQSKSGDRVGFKGKKYSTQLIGKKSFEDSFTDFNAFIKPRLIEAHRVLSPTGSLYFHIDYREVHYCKILLDKIFGRENFLNEIIWAYDYGAKPKNRWPAKHDNILFYVRNRNKYCFNADAIERIPYMAPGLVSKEKAKIGKLPTDTWWHTIVSPTGKEKTGYPTQKPIGVLRRIILASSRPGDLVLDFFAGSGTTGVAAAQLDRRFLLIDNNHDAIQVMRTRFDAEAIDYCHVVR